MKFRFAGIFLPKNLNSELLKFSHPKYGIPVDFGPKILDDYPVPFH